MKLFSLAFKNIKKSLKDYSVYFLTLVIAVSIFYIFNSIDSQTAMMAITESKMEMVETVLYVMSALSTFVAIILGFLIVYANNFLIKRRKKEIGIYLTLGMSKVKVSSILVLETIIVGVISLGVGLVLGIGLSQLLSIFTAKLFEVNMTNFTFVFSSSALVKTIINFTMIYLVVMIFNVISLNRFKLIDLLSASHKNEKVKIKNSWVIFITFMVSIVMIGWAYVLLYDDALVMLGDDKFMKMMILGAVGTFLLFLSISGFFLKVVQLRKKTYYNGLNMFVLKQVNNKINTHVISMTIISLMLLLTIGILSTSLSMASMMNDTLVANTPVDISVFSSSDALEEFRQLPEYQKIIKEDYLFNFLEIPEIKQGDFMVGEDLELFSNAQEMTMPIIKESDYNHILAISNRKDNLVSLSDGQYLLVADVPAAVDTYNNFLDGDNTIEFNNIVLKSKTNQVVELEVVNSSGNGGFIVISDDLANTYGTLSGSYNEYLVGNYQGDATKCEEQFINLKETFNQKADQRDSARIFSFTRIELADAAVGSKAMFTFIGLYLGIVFAIASGTVLAIEQLSESSDNKERYRILKQLGVDKPMINKSLLIQIGISFIVPLLVALVHSLVALNEINHFINLMANIDLASNIMVTTIFIVIVYGGYYLATYLVSNRIINE